MLSIADFALNYDTLKVDDLYLLFAIHNRLAVNTKL